MQADAELSPTPEGRHAQASDEAFPTVIASGEAPGSSEHRREGDLAGPEVAERSAPSSGAEDGARSVGLAGGPPPGGAESEQGGEGVDRGPPPTGTESEGGCEGVAGGPPPTGPEPDGVCEGGVGGPPSRSASSWQGLQAYAPALRMYERATIAASVIGGAAGGIVAGPIGISAGEMVYTPPRTPQFISQHNL
jgi:hypothetical protein